MKVNVKFFEEDEYKEINVENFNWDEFKIIESHENRVSCWYGKGSISGQHYISVNNEDYELHKTSIKKVMK